MMATCSTEMKILVCARDGNHYISEGVSMEGKSGAGWRHRDITGASTNTRVWRM